MTYTIKLIELECFQAQERDGDEIYITLNGTKVWEAHPDKMTHIPEKAHHVNQYDFAGGRKQTSAGWVALEASNPDAFAFKNRSGTSELQFWDADVLTRDDLLGETPIAENQAGGAISVIFQRSGAHYRLTYQVEVG